MNLFKDVMKTVFSEPKEVAPVSEVLTKKVRTTKTHQVLKHLQEKGSIDSWTAIQLYGATRLSAIIFILRRRGYDIISIPNSVLDRNNNVCNYTNYQLLKK